MKILLLFLLIFQIKFSTSVTFEEALSNLKTLETYIKSYKTEKSISTSLTHLIVSYIRDGKYTSFEWTIAGGTVSEELVEYIKKKDIEKDTNVESLRKYGDVILPTNEKMDFVHLFAVMNGIEYGDSYTQGFSSLVGWGGDSAELFDDIKNEKGNLDELINITLNNYLGKKGRFNQGDLIADLDAPIILLKKNNDNYFADLIQSYYSGDEWKMRIKNFVKTTFPNVNAKDLRNPVFERYDNDFYLNILECKFGLRKSSFLGCYYPGDLKSEFVNHRKAALYAFADYLGNALD